MGYPPKIPQSEQDSSRSWINRRMDATLCYVLSSQSRPDGIPPTHRIQQARHQSRQQRKRGHPQRRLHSLRPNQFRLHHAKGQRTRNNQQTHHDESRFPTTPRRKTPSTQTRVRQHNITPRRLTARRPELTKTSTIQRLATLATLLHETISVTGKDNF